MEQYTVTGMSCAACSTRVEKAVSNVSGVTSCSVNLLTNQMGVEGTAEPSDIIAAVEKAGYGATLKGKSLKTDEKNDTSSEDKKTKAMKNRLIASLVFLILLMYISMGAVMWDFPLPAFFDGNYIAIGILQLILTGIIMVINQSFFISGFKAIAIKSPNMDSLVALGSAAAFFYSVYALFLMTRAQITGGASAAGHYMHEFYFESAAMILTLITLGKMLEARSKGKTTNALKELLNLAPKTANIIREGKEVRVRADEVKKGDVFVVRPGENIPADGIVLEGSSAVDEAALTGESIPVDKEINDTVSAATLNQSGFLRCEATRVGEDTTLSKIIQLVSEASATKAPIAKIADKVSAVFVPVVIVIGVVTALVWLIAGQTVGFAVARGISVLVISCPCALGLATPVAIMVGSGVGAKNKILFKTAASLEQAGRTRVVVLDKTGTVTMGKPRVTDVIPSGDFKEEELIKYAYAIESKSEHPLARAVTHYAKHSGTAKEECSEFKALSGNGLEAYVNGEKILGGSKRFINTVAELSEEEKAICDRLADEGKTPLLFAKGGTLMGIIAVADTIKEESAEAVKELKNMGVKVVMLTGDNQKTAQSIAHKAGIERVISDVLPDGKAKVIEELKKDASVMMVGDGINDAPALTGADTGVAIGAGTDVAIEAAEVVLVRSKLSDVPAAIRLSRAVTKNIRENLFWAFCYNVIGIPVAAGVLIPAFGISLNPMFGAAAMSLSSFCVITNALRLNMIDIYSPFKDKKLKTKKKEKKPMEKTMKIEGMMCGHCEAAVKKALEALEGVAEARVSHTEGTAVLVLSADVSDEVIRKTVQDKDYKVISID